MADSKRTPEDRFWSKVHKTDSCWLWTGATNKWRYGLIEPQSYGGICRAHRYAWVLTHGPIPDGLYVCHSCDNPPCVNPAHLFLGTDRDNVRDMHQKGRARNGMEGRLACKRGHLYAEHAVILGSGRRECGPCARESRRKWVKANIEARRADCRARYHRKKAEAKMSGRNDG